jgi:uncharacterized phage protein (TIGR01671 family)
MNREIKFRAWHTQVVAMKPVEWMNFKGDLLKVPFYGNWAKSSCVLMQYTGLKDKNGKEIFEEDLVKWTDELGENPTIFKVAYEETRWVIVPIPDSLVGWYLGEKELEVIGNIYQNPELLAINQKASQP